MTARQIRRAESLWHTPNSLPVDEEHWMAFGRCAETDPEAFFPEKGCSARPAKKVCAGCPVSAQCLDYALRTDQRFGIFGGLSERERRKLKREAAA